MPLRKSLNLGLGVGICALLLLDQNPAQAYLDPGTGSYLFQAVIAVALSGLVALKLFWKNLVSWVKRSPPDTSEQDEDD